MKLFDHCPIYLRTYLSMSCIILSLLLFSTSAYAQNELLDQVKALSKVKKGAQFDPSDMPATANPYLSLLPPGTKPDYQGWRNYKQKLAQYNRLHQLLPSLRNNSASMNQRIEIDEDETTPGQNDTQSQGQFIEEFGSQADEVSRVIIHGASGSEDLEIEYTPAVGEEDDGSIPLANETDIQQAFVGQQYSGSIGDHPYEGISDFDFYKVDAQQGQSLNIMVNTPEPFLDLDPFLSIFDESGILLDFNDDGSPESYDSELTLEIPYDGTFYVCVGGFGALIPLDPFDSQSGSLTGEIGSEGEYEMLISFIRIPSDVDYYLFNLKKGDVFAAGLTANLSSSFLNVFKPSTELAVGTIFNTSAYPVESPINMEGNTSIYHIAEEDGLYAISVSETFGMYDLELFVSRSYLESNGGTQILFLDFDGADFDLNEFSGIPGSDVRQLTPFRDFLPDWGISDDPLTVYRLTQRITKVVSENIKKDLKQSKINLGFDVVVISNTGLFNNLGLSASSTSSVLSAQEDFSPSTNLHGLDDNSLALLGGFDISNNFSNSNLPISQVIVGGTIEESGISTIGIAQSIDPGNFDTNETALVLLDILSAPPIGDPASFSLNDIPLAPGYDKEDLLVTALGNIISHEAGHYFGNWHTDGLDEIQTLMDEGPGGVFNLIGMNPSGAFGDAQTIDVDFSTDYYSTLEYFIGTENTKNQTAWGLGIKSRSILGNRIASANSTTGARLSQAYPNPSTLNQVLSIDFKIDEDGPVKLELFDLRGEKLAVLFDKMAMAEQEYQLNFVPSAYQLKSGTYIYRMHTEQGTISKKIFLRK